MKTQIINDVINDIINDEKLREFYNKNLLPFNDIHMDGYLTYYISNEVLKNTNELSLKDIRDKTQHKLRTYRSRYKIPKDFNDLILYSENINYCTPRVKNTIFENQIKLLVIDNYLNKNKNYKVKNRSNKYATMISMATPKEVNTKFNIDSAFTVNSKDENGNNKKEVILKSDELYNRENNDYIPTYRFRDEKEYNELMTNLKNNPNVKFLKNGKTYIMSKSMDAKDIELMDFFQEEFMKIILNPRRVMIFDIENEIVPIIYKERKVRNIDYTINRLNKLSHMSFTIPLKIDYEKIKVPIKPIDQMNAYSNMHLFDANIYPDPETGRMQCEIFLSGIIENDLVDHRMYSINEEKINSIKNNFSKTITMPLLSDRYGSYNTQSFERYYDYESSKRVIRYPLKKNKKENLALLKEALQHLKDINFIIKDFTISANLIYIKYLPFDYFEMKSLNMDVSSIEI